MEPGGNIRRSTLLRQLSSRQEPSLVMTSGYSTKMKSLIYIYIYEVFHLKDNTTRTKYCSHIYKQFWIGGNI